jgi:hypothetical protein
MNKETIKKHMATELQRNQRIYDDGCGDINCTLLAENIAQKYDLYEGEDFNIPEKVFDAAVEAVEKWKSMSKPTVSFKAVRPTQYSKQHE